MNRLVLSISLLLSKLLSRPMAGGRWTRWVTWSSKRPKPTVVHVLGGALLALTVGAACGTDPTSSLGGEGEGEGEGETFVEHESRAPLCDDLVSADNPRELFPFALVDPAAVTDAIPFGNLEPEAPQEVLNHEVGFYIEGVRVPLTSPADLYVQSIERSFHAYDGVTDFGVAYHVCSYMDGEVRKPAVTGSFAHLGSLSAELQAFFDAELAKYDAGEPTAIGCNEDRTECGVSMNAHRDLLGDPAWAYVLEGGASLGTAGAQEEGGIGPAGVDTNLQDRRINDFAGNFYLNPDRLGAEEGPGVSWRYGVCTYDYFAEPVRSQYMAKIAVLNELRQSEDDPCGSIEVDRDAYGTVRGVWAGLELEGETMDSEFSAADIDVYLEKTAVLGDHFTRPDTHMMISTPIDVLSDWGSGNSPIVIERATLGDGDYEMAVNVPFAEAGPGVTWCYVGERFGGFEEAYLLLSVSEDGELLQLERVEDDCSLTDPSDRAFDPSSDTYFEMIR